MAVKKKRRVKRTRKPKGLNSGLALATFHSATDSTLRKEIARIAAFHEKHWLDAANETLRDAAIYGEGRMWVYLDPKKEQLQICGLKAWLPKMPEDPMEPMTPFFGIDRSNYDAWAKRCIKPATLWQRLHAAWCAFRDTI